MASPVDPRHVQALVATAGKRIAELAGGRQIIARMRTADSAEDLAFFLDSVDIGLDDPARESILEAARDADRWRDVHAALLRSAEHHLENRFSPSS